MEMDNPIHDTTGLVSIYALPGGEVLIIPAGCPHRHIRHGDTMPSREVFLDLVEAATVSVMTEWVTRG